MGKMNMVSHMVLGAPILLARQGLLHISREFPRIPDINRRKCTAVKERSKDACMLLPCDAEFFAIVVDRVAGVYIKPHGADEIIYRMQPQFASLARLLPGDSACLVIVYHCNLGKLHMGVYDLTRLSGVDLKAKTLLERHAILHETVSFNFKQFQSLRHQQGAPPHSEWEANVWVFWVGWQEACVNVVAHSTDLPFKPAYICRLDDDEYVKLLTPIKTAWP
jgi:hypothetical protein